MLASGGCLMGPDPALRLGKRSTTDLRAPPLTKTNTRGMMAQPIPWECLSISVSSFFRFFVLFTPVPFIAERCGTSG